MRKNPITARMIPSIFTLANLLFGFLALIWVIEGQYTLAAAMIVLSVLMDSLDGKVARRLSVSSDFGKELDSLSDLVSFGVAPAILTYQAILYPQPDYVRYTGLGIAAVFALCGAVRLARFNMLNITTYFVGVPITFAGGFMALLMFFRTMLPWYIYLGSMFILAFLMVSTFKVAKLGK
ncbi:MULTISPECIES: CDP-diacylglycerol--serine O-phosphatidyltransferase [Desulfosporosinus]|uniref:CDP-diacylglycerol--serine O-phosphatidyltransferase n=2 Tax=Desulfosporosinus TaxID=79206 RepID=A0A1M5WP71_9FIRM|nr:MULTISPECIES: CDP-diacylglycerol--serine O-phosphatidyltransferase [Desulfosporosinus]MDA8220324.1 CDP-diacylglycerol--serine O-phosphatidyltransferase [Desulfitobacterium hafniense]MCO1600409.1 CDP-diacylglycerol--serine O-phosphatidyltransferase [Desulfosporosinus nitroreducens]MCO5386777.1 CDP-diacylglycerol--serine O-phosphatidyltransferase [Desulfosporosinus sp.]MDO0821497.1 CDP-diacylglycerol--serine O-phosphatidyltransferase [Desulfosporosinus nitroreducens]SHH88793.1 CDP-diacylglyce